MDLGADGFQTVRHVVLPQLGSALLAGALLAFALSFDEVIVTTFTAGQQTTLPIWMLQELIRPRQRPVTNVVAVFIIALTFMPILAAYYLTRADEPAIDDETTTTLRCKEHHGMAATPLTRCHEAADPDADRRPLRRRRRRGREGAQSVHRRGAGARCPKRRSSR